MAKYDGIRHRREAPQGYAGSTERYPETHSEWVSRYDRLFAAYVGEPYTEQQVTALKLFRAVDPNGEVVGITRRITRDIQHVVDTDARALVGTMRLDTDDERARQIWRRSRVDEVRSAWARWCMSMGDAFVESVRTQPALRSPVRLVGYDPRQVRLEYDAQTGTELERVVISQPVFGASEVARDGSVTESQRLSRYVRILTRDRIDVYIDGVHQEDQSGEHGVGRVPGVHLRCLRYVEPEHSLWCAQGLEPALSYVDSMYSQLAAIGNRHANPILTITGADPRSDLRGIFRLGRVAAVASGASVDYTEPSLTGASMLLDAARDALASARATLPEFMFSEAGAGSSGTALSHRAAAFSSKMAEIRGQWYAGLGRLVSIAAGMEQGRAYDEAAEDYVVTGGPILQTDVAAELAVLASAREAGALTRVDYVRHMQRHGLVDDSIDPAAYVAEVDAEDAATRAASLAALGAGGVDVDDDTVAVDLGLGATVTASVEDA